MQRIQGSTGLSALECANPRLNKYIVRWDIQPTMNGEEQIGINYYEQWINYKPNLDQIKEIVLAGYNKIIDQQILEGFVWNDMAIWLSTENQFNYKAAYDLAVQSQGMSLPVMFKFGTTKEPVYYTFEDLETFTDFYSKAMGYINTKLAEGWKLKDSIDWSVYNVEE